MTLAALASGVVQIDRALRLAGISSLVAGSLPLDPSPNQQFSLDLLNLNLIDRVPDGQIPLVQFLRNIAFELRARGRADKSEIFERYANLVGNREGGVPPLPDPAALPEVVRNEVIVGVDDMVDFSFLAKGNEAGRSIARIRVPRFEGGNVVQGSNGPWIMAGTAWLIARDLAVTNHHVINARRQGEAAAADVDFQLQGTNSILEFDYDSAGAITSDVGVQSVVAKSVDLDYTLLRLKPAPARAALQISRESLQVGPAKRPALNIIQHPRGETKRVAFRNNLVTAADAKVVRYFTDTDYGSSGSPVCDDNWRVIALHRGALPAKNVQFQGKTEAYVNFGSQITAVLDDVGQSNGALKAEILAAQKR